MQWNNMRNNACVCCSTKQITHEEFSLLNHPKTSPVRLHYFLGSNSTTRTIKRSAFYFLKLLSACYNVSLRHKCWGFFLFFKCNQFTEILPKLYLFKIGLSLSCSFLLRFNCPQVVSAYDKSLGSVIKQIPGFTWLEFDLDVSALLKEHVYSSYNSECVL